MKQLWLILYTFTAIVCGQVIAKYEVSDVKLYVLLFVLCVVMLISWNIYKQALDYDSRWKQAAADYLSLKKTNPTAAAQWLEALRDSKENKNKTENTNNDT